MYFTKTPLSLHHPPIKTLAIETNSNQEIPPAPKKPHCSH